MRSADTHRGTGQTLKLDPELARTVREIRAENSGFWTMPLAWDVKAARLEVAEPAVPEDIRVLADYHQEPASLVMWSGATPAGAITAEVVELKPPTMKQLKRIDVKNRMVLTEPPPTLSQRGALKASLYKLGAPVIPGSDPGEEVLEVGHVFELGAQDNSTGVAAMLEAVTPSR